MEDSDDDLGPEDEDAWLFEDLNVLMKLWQRKREKEALLALIFEVGLRPCLIRMTPHASQAHTNTTRFIHTHVHTSRRSCFTRNTG